MALRRLIPVLLFTLLLGAMPLLTKELTREVKTPRALLKTRNAPDAPPSQLGGSPGDRGDRPARTSAVLELNDELTARVVDQLALRQLAHDFELELTDEQWGAFARIAAHHQAIRHAYEASVAVLQPSTDGRLRLQIPVYGNAGDALRDAFYLSLEVELGAGPARQIATTMGQLLDSHFGGFGVSVQTLEIDAAPGSPLADCLITRTVTFWNQAEDDERLTTRRESHWPAVEDPTGQQWGPFLALLAAYQHERAGS